MKQGVKLELERCPHCMVANPHLHRMWGSPSNNHAGTDPLYWAAYSCATCGRVVLAYSKGSDDKQDVVQVWPPAQVVSDTIPVRAREFLAQAMASLHAPSGAVMLAASAIDAMLKNKGYKEKSLYANIDAASKDHLITAEMAAWAHEVRLDANDQRHADDDAPLPNAADAAKVLEFAEALGQFLYVLPARIERGRKA